MLIYSQGHLHSCFNSYTSGASFQSGLCEVFDTKRPWCRITLLFTKPYMVNSVLIICEKSVPHTTGCLPGYLICIPLHQQRGASQQGPDWTLQLDDG